MIPRIHTGGRGVRGLLAYITHDPPSAGKRQPTTDERVGLVAGLNLPTDDPHLAGLIMARTAADAEDIKQLAGTSSRGRKLKAPFSHLSLSWSPDEPRPDRVEMLRATEEALKAIGMDACQALVVEHTDTAHPHVHVAACRVDPETGKACGRKNDARKLSTWAAKYERSRERIQVPNRIARRQAREEYRAVVDVQVDDRAPIDEAKKKARAVVPLPPMQSEARRGPGGPDTGGAAGVDGAVQGPGPVTDAAGAGAARAGAAGPHASAAAKAPEGPRAAHETEAVEARDRHNARQDGADGESDDAANLGP